MINLFNNYNISLKKDDLEFFDNFFNFLIKENNKYNLTTIKKKEEYYYKHILDSLFALNFIKDNSLICDIGPGAGFPSIPLSLFLKNSHFDLIDSVNKKVNFLNFVKQNYNLLNINPIHSRIEDYALNYREYYDYVIGRAVAPLNTFLEYAAPLTKVNGYIIVYKGLNYLEELNNANKAIYIFNLKLIENKNFNFIFNKEINNRNILIFKKLKTTPEKFPRKNNKPRIKPIY